MAYSNILAAIKDNFHRDSVEGGNGNPSLLSFFP